MLVRQATQEYFWTKKVFDHFDEPEPETTSHIVRERNETKTKLLLGND